MKSYDENQNLMSTLLPLKIVRVPRRAASQILGLSRYIGLLVYCDISLKRYNILVRLTYRNIALLL